MMSTLLPALSVCTTVKNRSRVEIGGRELRLFPRSVASLRDALEGVAGEIVVADWGSEDWPLEEWLAGAASPVPARVIRLEGTFSRGKGLNEAAKAARGDVLFFADADALVSPALIAAGIEHASSGKAYFPVLFAYDSPEHSGGRWCDGGFGHCFLRRGAFEAAGGWPEYRSWGREDKEFWAAVRARMPVVRERAAGFHHQWHPEDPDWKNRYGEESAAFEKTREKVLATQAETAESREVFQRIDSAIPRAARYILVDEDRFAKPPGSGERILPFPERDGVYWGIPENDAAALVELQRLQALGVRYIVFPRIAFWWLDHFAGFGAHLRVNAGKVLDDPRVVIFDLNAPGRTP